MKKSGFTLAEVLITLGIVGVVAALTAPALVMSSRNEANAAKLAVVVSNIENAFSNAIAQEGVDNLYGTRMWSNAPVNTASANIQNFVGELGRYMVLNGFLNSDGGFYGSVKTCPMLDTGGTNNALCRAQGQRFGGGAQMITLLTKSGAAIFIRTFNNQANLVAQRNAAISLGCTYYTNAADIVIDVNGTSAPNTFGRDIFWFQVGENGILYPYGGRDVSRVDSGNNSVANTWNGAGTYACSDASKGSEASRGELGGIGCTARLIHDSYKMNY